jgi:SWI/SNF-related matrix-associated actin-dependent regulator of chromatin subfamily B protein 1
MRSRRGLAIPGCKPIRTYRMPGIGFPELDPSVLALAAAANTPTSRQAAAAAASLKMANMVASENRTALMPHAMPIIPNSMPVVPTEKKPKGLFKPPSYPSSVLRPRARVTAPTLSTAMDVALVPAPAGEGESAAGENGNGAPSTAAVPPPDSKISKLLAARRAKELEREAKEKEYADGQHANYVDGVWHCSNCGCPESIAIGRRKGPLGDKSQCGPCGMYSRFYLFERRCLTRRPKVNSGIDTDGRSRSSITATPTTI